MLKCLLWGTGLAFSKYINLVKYFEKEKQIEVVGVTSRESYCKICGYDFIGKEEIPGRAFDAVIVMVSEQKIQEVYCELENMGVPEECVIPCSVMEIPYFNFSSYLKLKADVPSIISCNCWGGILYHRLGLKFKSPFINMYMDHREFIRMCRDLRAYMDTEIVWKEYRYDETLRRKYPVGRCKDVDLHFNHFVSYEEAKTAWDRRKERINWDNLYLMLYEDDADIQHEFDALKYDKKVCFTYRDSGVSSNVYLGDYVKCLKREMPLWEIVNGIAKGLYVYTDLLKLLMDAKVDRIVAV